MRARFWLLICILGLCLFVPRSTAQVTSNVLMRVLLIRPAGTNLLSTGFTVEVDGRQYLITAKHSVAVLKDEGTLEIFRKGSWSSLPVKVLRCEDPIDIAVLVPPMQLTVTYPLEPTMIGAKIAQDVYFVGYPYGMFTAVESYHIPFVKKKGILSAASNDGDAHIVYIDGHNNPGFSGGPVVFRDLDRGESTFKVLGVISGFQNERAPVFTPVNIDRKDITAEDILLGRILQKNGQIFRLEKTDKLVDSNTGIVVAYNISHVIDLLKRNAIGPKVDPGFK